jgi:desulfoferrodoxin-like iron-binding protein
MGNNLKNGLRKKNSANISILKGGVMMTEKGQVYICEICGNKVQVMEAGAGTLVCCGQDMNLVE